jgi:hypothetical protein
MDMGDMGESFSLGLAGVRSGFRGSDDEHDIRPFTGMALCEAFVFSFPSELVQRHGDGEELLQRQLGATTGGEL